MFSVRELYMLSRAIFEYKNNMKKSDSDSKVKFSPEQFDEYLEVSLLHLKLKDMINGR